MRTAEQIAKQTIRHTYRENLEPRIRREIFEGARDAAREAQRELIPGDENGRYGWDDVDPDDGHPLPFGPGTAGILDNEEGGYVAYASPEAAARIVAALTASEPQFAPESEPDEYHSKWAWISASEQQTWVSMHLAADGLSTGARITYDQARHILAYLSEQSRKEQA